MGLLDIWNDWRKETGSFKDAGTFGSSTDFSKREVNRFNRSNLNTAGGVDNSEASADMDQRIPRKRGEIPTPPKYIREKKEVRDRLGRVVEQGSPINAPGTVGHPMRNKTLPVIPGQDASKTPNLYQDKIMQGGVGTKQGEDPSWWQGLANKFNSKFDTDKAMAHWKEKGGFEGLMANPAFTMGLAFMQAGAEGKTMGAGALDNVMKAAGISSHYKQILKDRQEEPIQATAADMAEVEDLLGAVNIKEGNWAENLWSKIKSRGKANPGAEWSAAVEEISLKYQEKVRAAQKKLKTAGKPQTLRRSDKLKIMQELIDSKEIEKDNPWFAGIFSAGTLKKKLPGMARGGPVQAGKPYVVGEKGPEVIIPRSDGNVLANDDSQIFAMLLASNPQLQNVSKQRAERILRSRFPEYFEG